MIADPEKLITFRLAERLGLTVAELRSRMSRTEFKDWLAYDQIQMPESWHQTDTICRVIVNSSGFTKRLAKPGDHLPPRASRPRKPFSQDVRAAMDQMLGRA